MKVKEMFKQRQLVKHKQDGEICQVSKRKHGVYLLDPITKKVLYKILDGYPVNWEAVK